MQLRLSPTSLLAALLHDILDKKYVSPEQSSDPYAFFLPFFEEMSCKHAVDLIADGRGRLVTQVIDNVSWSTEKKLREKGLWTKWHDECLELHCVQDADRLDAIGAFGNVIYQTHLLSHSNVHFPVLSVRYFALRGIQHYNKSVRSRCTPLTVRINCFHLAPCTRPPMIPISLILQSNTFTTSYSIFKTS